MTEDQESTCRRHEAPIGHVLGQNLDELSVLDFDERIALLRAEIDRLEEAKRQKQTALEAAGSIFRR